VSSPTTGTALEHGDIPLPRVLAAIWWLARHESGADPEGVAHALGSSTEAAWRWLRSLRDVYRVMWRDQLRGVIELAKVPLEIGSGHCIVGVAAEMRGRGRVRIARLERVDGRAMMQFAATAIARGSCVHTTRWEGYRLLRARGFGHITKLGEDDGDMSHAAQLASIARLWLRGTSHAGSEQLDYYLDELNFRLDARVHHPASDHGATFNALLGLALTPRAPRAAIGMSG
jgi:hypothetical protein